MRLLDPRPWHLIAPGTVVLIDGIPRSIGGVSVGRGGFTVYAEGLAPFRPAEGAYAQPVELDDTDAIGNILRAGFTLTPIKES